MSEEQYMSEAQSKPDMSGVVAGSRVRYRDGTEVTVVSVDHSWIHPFCTTDDPTQGRMYHLPDGTCCVDSEAFRKYDIIQVLWHPEAQAAPDIKQPGPIQASELTLTENNKTPQIVGGAIELMPCLEEPTLRDRFAMAALQGLLAHGERLENASRWCWCAADKSLEERES